MAWYQTWLEAHSGQSLNVMTYYLLHICVIKVLSAVIVLQVAFHNVRKIVLSIMKNVLTHNSNPEACRI